MQTAKINSQLQTNQIQAVQNPNQGRDKVYTSFSAETSKPAENNHSIIYKILAAIGIVGVAGGIVLGRRHKNVNNVAQETVKLVEEVMPELPKKIKKAAERIKLSPAQVEQQRDITAKTREKINTFLEENLGHLPVEEQKQHLETLLNKETRQNSPFILMPINTPGQTFLFNKEAFDRDANIAKTPFWDFAYIKYDEVSPEERDHSKILETSTKMTSFWENYSKHIVLVENKSTPFQFEALPNGQLSTLVFDNAVKKRLADIESGAISKTGGRLLFFPEQNHNQGAVVPVEESVQNETVLSRILGDNNIPDQALDPQEIADVKNVKSDEDEFIESLDRIGQPEEIELKDEDLIPATEKELAEYEEKYGIQLDSESLEEVQEDAGSSGIITWPAFIERESDPNIKIPDVAAATA